MAAKEMWQWIHCNYGEELCLNSSDDDYVAPPSFIEEPIKDECITPSRLIQVSLFLGFIHVKIHVDRVIWFSNAYLLC